MTCDQCGHSRDSHLHYRDGTDCGYCHCDRFRISPQLQAERFWMALMLLWAAFATGVVLAQLGVL